MFVCGSRIDHGLCVGDVAVGQYALQVFAWNGQDEGVGAGGHNQAVVLGGDGLARRAGGQHLAFDPVHAVHGPTGVQGDAVVRVPGPVVQDDFIQRLFTGQHGAEQNAVVVGMRLGTEHGDVVHVRGNLEQLFQRAHTGHAVADHHQLLPLHGRWGHVHGQAAFSTWAWRV